MTRNKSMLATTRTLGIAAVLLCACGVVGCSSSQHAAGDTKVTRQGDRVLVEVLLNEYKIHMPTSVPAGRVTMQVRNTGSHEHSIRISGNGVDAKLPNNLKPGESTELNVELKPGIYKVDCPVGPHAALGMRLKLTVTD